MGFEPSKSSEGLGDSNDALSEEKELLKGKLHK
jgi:hypothetical protein